MKLLDRVPWVKNHLASVVRRGLTKVFDPGLVTTERVVEYPFVFQNLGEIEGPVLDMGCCHSRLPVALTSRGFHVVGIDINRYPYRHPYLQTVRGDIIHTPFTDESFPVILAISVVEHLGIGHYGDPTGTSGDVMAVKEIARILGPGGKALITVPFGRALTNDWMRVYDPPRLGRLLAPFQTRRVEYAVSSNGLWAPSNEMEAALVDWNGPDRSIAMIVALKSGAARGES